jgi:hypothetical protein
MKDYHNLEGRFIFAQLLIGYMRQPDIGLRLMESIVSDANRELATGNEKNVEWFIRALIQIGLWYWHSEKNETNVQSYFDGALKLIDRFEKFSDLAGKIFFERCLIMSEQEQGNIALNLAFELYDSFQCYGNQQKSKKMFYVHMAIASIAHEELHEDIAIDHLWFASLHLDEINKAVSSFLKRQYKHRFSDLKETYLSMMEHLENYL